MGQDTAATVAEITQIRERLDGEFRALEQRLPSMAVAGKRLVGVLIGGGFVATFLLMLVRRGRKRRRARALVMTEGQTFTAEIRLIPS
ncbi:MAG: hypothetical protein ACXVQY_12540 [Actinomycetota bacterium]